jgi:uncharacterized protein (TIGR03435 family)
VSGGPKWIDETRYSITAVPPATCQCSKFIPISRKRPPPDEELLMLRQLLVERFHLRLHEEQKKGRVFILQVGKDAPKLDDSKDKRAFPFVGFGPNLVEDQPEFVEMRGENASMSRLASRCQKSCKYLLEMQQAYSAATISDLITFAAYRQHLARRCSPQSETLV